MQSESLRLFLEQINIGTCIRDHGLGGPSIIDTYPVDKNDVRRVMSQ